MKFSSFATDLALEEEGVWIDFGEGAKLKIRRVGNTENKKLWRALLKPWRSVAARSNIPEGKWKEISCEALSKTILVDWEGWEDDKGKPIKYSQQNAYDMLIGMKDFQLTVEDLANSQATFARDVEVEAGND